MSSTTNRTVLAVLAAGIVFGVGPFRNAKCTSEEPPPTNVYQPTFAGKYSDAEINRLREDVNKSEYEVGVLRDKVHHQENMVGLADTKRGRANGDYGNEVRCAEPRSIRVQCSRFKTQYSALKAQ